MDHDLIKQKIIAAGYKAVNELIKVAEEEIITGLETDLSADKLKNAAATKRLAIEDAFQILNRIELERDKLSEVVVTLEPKIQGFAEKRSK
jgi:hypothetical protein